MPNESESTVATSGDAGGESSIDSTETTSESCETAKTELCSNEAEQELYDPGYDPSEYEQELYDFSEDPETPLYNDKGEPVEDVPLYRSGDYLDYEDPEYLRSGTHKVKWPDGEGFEEEPTETVLSEGTIIARYGPEQGHSATDVGTDPSKLSLPYDTTTQEYHEYRICCDVTCKSGRAKAAFDVEGGGKQYTFSKSFAEMVSDGTMEKIK